MDEPTIVLDGNASEVRVKFYDADGEPLVPSAAQVSIFCETNAQSVRSAEAISPLAAQVDIPVTPTENTLIDSDNAEEVRRMCVETDPGTDQAYRQDHVWRVVARGGCA